MKYSTLPAFEKHLEAAAPGHFADIYMILSKEAFLRKQAVDRLVQLVLKGEQSPELCLVQFDSEKHNIETILQELETFSFFVKKRVVVVHNADGFEKASTAKLEAFFNAPNRAICLVLEASSINRATNFYKKAEKIGVVLDAAEEKPWEKEKSVSDWLQREAASQGKQITPSALQMLVKQLGTDQALLHGELQKLVCYVGDRQSIDEQDVAAICTKINLDNAWQLGEAIFRRDPAAALRISKGLMEDGIALIALLRQIRSQFQTEYQVCSIITHGGSAAEVTQEFPYMKGSILDRHLRQAQGYGMQRFKDGLLAIDAAELAAKNSSGDPELLAERLIIKLST